MEIDNESEQRKLMVRFFYPTQPQEKTEKYVYLSNKLPYLIPFVAQHYSIPKWLASCLFSTIETQAYNNTPLSTVQQKYPVILFSHGLLGEPSDTYYTLLANLASHGYIVAAIDHPFYNLLTVYPNNTIATSHELTQQFHLLSPTEQKQFQCHAIKTYKKDIKAVLAALYDIHNDKTSLFYNQLNLAALGVMGHSAGGTAAIEVSRIDERIKACINLDGWYDQCIGEMPIKQPLLLLFAAQSVEITEPTENYLKNKEITRKQYYEREQKINEHKKNLCNTPHCQMNVIPNISHNDFNDFIFLKWPLRLWNAINPYWISSTINQYVVKFFDHNLKQTMQ